MSLPIALISTDFDGTLFAEFENPPIPPELEDVIADLQASGAQWVINTGREMASLMESLARARVGIEPDFLILVEREIYQHHGSQYVGLGDWNEVCAQRHADLFSRVRRDLAGLVKWVNERFHAQIYEDVYSPFCLIARNNGDADAIHQFLNEYAKSVPDLTVVRNDVYARFSHSAYNKGTTLAELTNHLGLTKDQVFAAGDHLNDLPMLSRTYARWLGAPINAVEEVKLRVEQEHGYISRYSHGKGVADAIKYYLDAV